MLMGQTSLTLMNLRRLVTGLVGYLDHCHHWLMVIINGKINVSLLMMRECSVHFTPDNSHHQNTHHDQ